MSCSPLLTCGAKRLGKCFQQPQQCHPLFPSSKYFSSSSSSSPSSKPQPSHLKPILSERQAEPVFREAKKIIRERRKTFESRTRVLLGNISPKQPVPSHIPLPPYVTAGVTNDGSLEIKTPEQIAGMRLACQLAAHILNFAGSLVKSGITTDDIDSAVHAEIIKHGAYPSPLMYPGGDCPPFPKSICTSVNDVIIHGIPDSRVLQEGDVLHVDITVYLNGYHGDTSRMFLVGGAQSADAEAQRLISVGLECLQAGINAVGPRVPMHRIGRCVSLHAARNGYSVNHDFTGHGIGSYFHGLPYVSHAWNSMGKDEIGADLMMPGMTFTIEPIIMEGGADCTILKDGWTVVSNDKGRAAQNEHTILVTEHGAEILTKIP